MQAMLANTLIYVGSIVRYFCEWFGDLAANQTEFENGIAIVAKSGKSQREESVKKLVLTGRPITLMRVGANLKQSEKRGV